MKLLTSKRETAEAYKRFLWALKRGAKGPYKCTIGWQGGNRSCNVHFHEQLGFWFRLDEFEEGNRYWCAFGVNSPDEPMLHIACEINPPHEGVNLRIAGMFLRDSAGHIYIAHTGKIGGGRKGIGKSAFTKSYRGRRVKVELPEGNTSEALLLSRLSDKKLPLRIAEFIHAVEKFKSRHAVRESPTPDERSIVGFKPEFSRSYQSRVRWTGRIRKLHGQIVNTLSRKLERMGYRIANDKHRDLFIAARQKRVRVLFEAKTGVGSTDIYTGVGQLLVNGSLHPKASKLVLVLPSEPHKRTRDVLDALSILTLLFYRHGSEIRFRNLADVLVG